MSFYTQNRRNQIEIKDKEENARLKAELESTRAQLSATKSYNNKRSQLERWGRHHAYQYGVCMEEMRLWGPKIKDKMNTSYNWNTKFSKTNPAKIIELELLPNKEHELKKIIHSLNQNKKENLEETHKIKEKYTKTEKEKVKTLNIMKNVYEVIYNMNCSPIGSYKSGKQKKLFDDLKIAAKYPKMEYYPHRIWRHGSWWRDYSHMCTAADAFDKFLTNLN